MKLALKATETYLNEDRSWLGSAHGTQNCRPVTLDDSTFSAVTWPIDTTGYVDGATMLPSGVALGKITATGWYGPYDDTAVDGRAVLVGHLYSTVRIQSGVAGAKTGAALFEHGRVVTAKLPANNGVDTAGKADVKGQIIYI